MKDAVLFAGCTPEVAAFGDRIIAVGPRARAAAGRTAQVVKLRGTAWPGLIDSHIHLEGLADRKLTVDLTGSANLAECLKRVRGWARPLKKDAWVLGGGWYNDMWPESAFPAVWNCQLAPAKVPTVTMVVSPAAVVLTQVPTDFGSCARSVVRSAAGLVLHSPDVASVTS